MRVSWLATTSLTVYQWISCETAIRDWGKAYSEKNTDPGKNGFGRCALTKFTESLCLCSKNVRNRVKVLAGVQLCGERMSVEALSRQPLILVRSSIKYCGEVIGRRANCLIACGHGDNRERGENAQAVRFDRRTDVRLSEQLVLQALQAQKSFGQAPTR